MSQAWERRCGRGAGCASRPASRASALRPSAPAGRSGRRRGANRPARAGAVLRAAGCVGARLRRHRSTVVYAADGGLPLGDARGVPGRPDLRRRGGRRRVGPAPTPRALERAGRGGWSGRRGCGHGGRHRRRRRGSALLGSRPHRPTAGRRWGVGSRRVAAPADCGRDRPGRPEPDRGRRPHGGRRAGGRVGGELVGGQVHGSAPGRRRAGHSAHHSRTGAGLRAAAVLAASAARAAGGRSRSGIRPTPRFSAWSRSG